MDAKKITQTFLSECGLNRPGDINWGFCYYWAYVAYKLFGGELVTVDYYGGHAFIKVNGLYYDSETPEGVENWSNLLFFQFYSVSEHDAIEQEPDDFVYHWGLVGSNGWCDETIEKIIAAVPSF